MLDTWWTVLCPRCSMAAAGRSHASRWWLPYWGHAHTERRVHASTRLQTNLCTRIRCRSQQLMPIGSCCTVVVNPK